MVVVRVLVGKIFLVVGKSFLFEKEVFLLVKETFLRIKEEDCRMVKGVFPSARDAFVVDTMIARDLQNLYDQDSAP